MSTLRRAGRGMKGALLVLVALLGTAPMTVADVIRVPEDHAVLQDAIDAAAAGDVIAITGGTHNGVKIDKPLTLVGSASQPPLIRRGLPIFYKTAEPCIDLSTEGRVVLAGLVINTYGAASLLNNPVAIAGDAGELLILHCDVDTYAQPWGYTKSTPAIAVWSDHILIVDSQVRGGQHYYSETTTTIQPSDNSGAGLYANSLSASGLCTVLDSEVRGGHGPIANVVYQSVFSQWHCGDPGGVSGPAVGGAVTLVHGNSVFAAGEAGHAWVYYSGSTPVGMPDEECDLPVAPVFDPADVGNVVELDASTLGLSSGGFVEGQTSVLTLGALENGLLLVGPPDPTAPQVGIAGALYLDGQELSSTPLSLSSPVTRNLTPGPVDPAQWGTVIGLQLYSPATGLTRPVFMAVLAP